MKQLKEMLHWINYDYVVINNDLNECHNKISNLIDAVINNGSKDYDINYIRKHIDKLTLNFHIHKQADSKSLNLYFGLIVKSIFSLSKIFLFPLKS